MIKLRQMRLVANVARVEELKNKYKILMGREKWLFLKPRILCDDNIKMNLKRIRCKTVEWVNLTQDGAPVAG
jgi:hypothetical protein